MKSSVENGCFAVWGLPTLIFKYCSIFKFSSMASTLSAFVKADKNWQISSAFGLPLRSRSVHLKEIRASILPPNTINHSSRSICIAVGPTRHYQSLFIMRVIRGYSPRLGQMPKFVHWTTIPCLHMGWNVLPAWNGQLAKSKQVTYAWCLLSAWCGADGQHSV